MQFTGDRRPPRRRFAAAAACHAVPGTAMLFAGIVPLAIGVAALWEPGLSFWADDAPPPGSSSGLARAIEDADADSRIEAFATLTICVALAVGCGAVAIYLLRGRGPTMGTINRRVSARRRDQFRAEARFLQRAKAEGDTVDDGGRAERREARRERFRKVAAWAALNLTEWGRARKAFERGDLTFESTLTVDGSRHESKVESIQEEGWILVQVRMNPPEEVEKLHRDGTRTMEQTQTATFYFERDETHGNEDDEDD